MSRNPSGRAAHLLSGLLALALGLGGVAGNATEPFDLAIVGGRVMDPMTGLDAIRNVGIREGSIVYLGEDEIEGTTRIDASGLVVAPGFIDLNNHDLGSEYFRMKAHDGVTSALVLESGAVHVDDWYEAYAGKALIHHGVGIDTGGARMLAAGDSNVKLSRGQVDAFPTPELANRALTPDELAATLELVDAGLARGAVAVSMGIEYLPGMTHSEVLEMFRLAAKHGAFVFAHIRDWDSTRDYDHLYEMIGASSITGAPAHITHLNSVGADYVDRYLDFITAVQQRGIDVSTDGYPYTAGLTGIEATFFDDWESWPGERFERYQWAATGEWLTRETFGKYRETGGWVLIHWMKEEWIRSVIGHPIAMVASDGAWDGGRGHPRGAGTYARVLGRYVRDEGLLSLMDALGKMTLMPAHRLEARVPAMRKKGRLQIGADADITIFDPATVLDRATYSEPTLPSAGIRHVLVLGTPVIADGQVVEGVLPGQPIRAGLFASSTPGSGDDGAASPGDPGDPGSLLITGVSIIQPEEGTVTAPRDILITGGEILEIGEPGSIPSDRADRVLAAPGLYAHPGLIDVHTHMGDGGIGEQTQADREGVLRQFLRYGVTSILNLGGGGGTEEELAEWKRRCKARELDCPDILGTGVLVTAPGSHPIGTIWNLPPDTDPEVIYRRGAVAIAEDEDVTAVLDRKTAMGVDAVKVIIEDWDPNDPLPRLSKAKVAELAQAGHARGLRVFAHVSAAEHVEDALASGIDGVMHSAEDPIPDATLASMAKAGMFYVATLALYDGFFDRALGTVGNDHEPYALAGSSSRAINSLRKFEHSPFTAERAENSKTVIHDNLRRASALGVPLALGTDVNNPSVFPGYSAHEELELMVEAGLTPARALAAATAGGAALIGRESTVGRIEPGYEADILILRENPLEDILGTRTLHSVIHDGHLFEDVVGSDSGELDR